MRILHALNHTERLSGNVHAAIDLACAQAQAGYSVAVVSRGGDFDDILRAHGVEIFKLDMRRRVSRLVRAEGAFLKLLRGWRPDIVHAHMMTSAVLAFPICQLSRIPLVTSVHNAFERTAILMALGRRVIAVSGAVAETLKRRGFPKGRLRVVLNGTIGSARFEPIPPSSATLKKPAILFVGGLHHRKGVPVLISAFSIVCRRNNECVLYIVGEGPESNVYESMARSLGLEDRIRFCGAQKDVRQSMSGTDIFVLPSLFDPAPLVISEAREAGCAIIASDVDGIPEMLEFGQAGILVPPGKAEPLAAALESLLDDDEALAMWKRQSQHNIDRLRLRRVVDDMHRVYLDAAYSRRRPKDSKSGSLVAGA